MDYSKYFLKVLHDHTVSKSKLISNIRDTSYEALRERGSIEIGIKEPKYWANVFHIDYVINNNKIKFFFMSRYSIKMHLLFVLYISSVKHLNTFFGYEYNYDAVKKEFKQYLQDIKKKEKLENKEKKIKKLEKKNV